MAQAQINPGDRLNDFIRQQSYFSAGLTTPVEKRANGLWYWRNTGLPVNVRRANGRSGVNVSASSRASQAAKRAGPGAGPGAARAMYEKIKSEIEAEVGSCPIIRPEQLDMIELMIKDTDAMTGSVTVGGVRSTRKRKQRGGAKFYDELKRVLRILCILPAEVAKNLDEQSAAALQPVGDTLMKPEFTKQIASLVRSKLPKTLLGLFLVRDLGSNNSLTVRAINAIVSIIGTFVNPSLITGWYSGLIGNLGTLASGSGPALVGVAAAVVMNYEGVRIFQGIYNRLVAAYGAAPTEEQLATVFEGTIVEYIRYVSKRAMVKAYPRLPEGIQRSLPDGLRKEALDYELNLYMKRGGKRKTRRSRR